MAGSEAGALGGFLVVASLVFLLLSIFLPGLAWFGVDKVVLFSSDAEDSSLEVRSSFRFAYLWARQEIVTEIDAVVFEEHGYGWCKGTTPDMALATQQALCRARRLMWACTVAYLGLGLVIIALLACGGGGSGSVAASPRRRWSPRVLAHALTALAALQLLAGVLLSWAWTGMKRGVEAHFTHNYIEVNDLRLRVGWSWYLAGLAGLATTALLLLGLRLSWRAERQQHHQQGQAASKDAPVPRALNRGRQLSGPPVGGLQGERRQPRRLPPSETTQRAYHYS